MDKHVNCFPTIKGRPEGTKQVSLPNINAFAPNANIRQVLARMMRYAFRPVVMIASIPISWMIHFSLFLRADMVLEECEQKLLRSAKCPNSQKTQALQFVNRDKLTLIGECSLSMLHPTSAKQFSRVENQDRKA